MDRSWRAIRPLFARFNFGILSSCSLDFFHSLTLLSSTPKCRAVIRLPLVSAKSTTCSLKAVVYEKCLDMLFGKWGMIMYGHVGGIYTQINVPSNKHTFLWFPQRSSSQRDTGRFNQRRLHKLDNLRERGVTIWVVCREELTRWMQVCKLFITPLMYDWWIINTVLIYNICIAHYNNRWIFIIFI